MAVFKVNEPLETREPFIAVDRLPLGRHRFQLVVEDQFGNASQPDEITVTVRRPIVGPARPVVTEPEK
jgi:hypothetical protein